MPTAICEKDAAEKDKRRITPRRRITRRRPQWWTPVTKFQVEQQSGLAAKLLPALFCVFTHLLASFARLGQPRAAVPTRDPWLGAYASSVTVGAVYCGHVAEIDRVFEVEAGD